MSAHGPIPILLLMQQGGASEMGQGRGRVRVILDLESGDPVCGTVGAAGRPPRRFYGWLELAALLRQVRPSTLRLRADGPGAAQLEGDAPAAAVAAADRPAFP